MHRKYNIRIHVNEGLPVHNDRLITIFGCSVSEPSNWVDYGSTRKRGLTFLDENGKELNSEVFEHQRFFNAGEERNISEKDEIKELIYEALLKNYQIDPIELTIDVTEEYIF